MTSLQTVATTLAAYDTIIIHRHLNPDPDAFGSQMGLATILRAAYPQKRIYTVGEPDARLNWIGTPETVPDAAYAGALVVVIDTANLARIADNRYTMGAKLLKLDHHPDRELFGDISYVDTNASSSSEIVADLALSTPALALDATSAAALYAGIIGDTGRFLYDLTTAHTHEVVARLMACGIDAPAIGRQEEEITPAAARLRGYAYTHLAVSPHGAATLTLTQAQLREFGLAPGEDQLALSAMGELTTVRAWALFTEQVDGGYRVELRSKTKSINPLAVSLGGGGHPLASGAKATVAQLAGIAAALDDLLA